MQNKIQNLGKTPVKKKNNTENYINTLFVGIPY